MRTAGLHAGQLAVAYDDADSTVAARLWWMLRYHGHERVAVLDGGYKAWVVAGLPTSKVIRRPEPGDFTVTSTGGMPVLDEAGAAEIRSILVETGALAECELMIDSSVAEGLAALEHAPMTGEAKLALAELAVVATARRD